jgi:hypothetical protein
MFEKKKEKILFFFGGKLFATLKTVSNWQTRENSIGKLVEN